MDFSINKNNEIAVIGSGTMGMGIAQVAATYGNKTWIFDINKAALNKAQNSIEKGLDKLLEKGKISASERETIQANLNYTDNLSDIKNSKLLIEAVFENLELKHKLFKEIEDLVAEDAIIATNTSSLSIISISSVCKNPGRVIGIHFFNPANIISLVEIIPSVHTLPEVTESSLQIIKEWGKLPVLAKDTPGFIVNRIARPFYSEALRILDEGIANIATIDWACKEFGGFRMGPFELMDMIGHDVNYKVTETVWEQFYYDPKFKPSITQKRLLEGGLLGKKSGRGFYDYRDGAINPEPVMDIETGKKIFQRILFMIFNEAADTLYLNVASRDDIDFAMSKAVNYPRNLFEWADEFGIETIVENLNELYNFYCEDRYRVSPKLKLMLQNNEKFYGKLKKNE